MIEIKEKLLDNLAFYKSQANQVSSLEALRQVLEPGQNHVSEGDHSETVEHIGLEKLPNLGVATSVADVALTPVTLASEYVKDRYSEYPLIQKGVNVSPLSGTIPSEGVRLEGSAGYFHRFGAERSFREFRVVSEQLSLPRLFKSRANQAVVTVPGGEIEWSFRDVAVDGSKSAWSDPSTITAIPTTVDAPVVTSNSFWTQLDHDAIVNVGPLTLNQGEDTLADVLWWVYEGSTLRYSTSGDPTKLSHQFAWGDLGNGTDHVLIVQFITENYGSSPATSINFKTKPVSVESPIIIIDDNYVETPTLSVK